MSKDLGDQLIKLSDIIVDSEFNCRGVFLESEIYSLAQSIRNNNGQLIQKCSVRKKEDGTFTLVAGFRRLAALKYLGVEEYTFSVWEMTDLEAMVFNISENVERQALNIQQEANAVFNLSFKMGITSMQEIGKMLGRGAEWARTRFEFYHLDPAARELVLAGHVPTADIRKLFTIQEKAGHEHLMSALRECQNAYDEKRKPQLVGSRVYTTKKQRTTFEINNMMLHLSRYVPYFLSEAQMAAAINEEELQLVWPKCMAWAAGNISTAELFDACSEFCAIIGKTFVFPKDFVPGYTAPKESQT